MPIAPLHSNPFSGLGLMGFRIEPYNRFSPYYTPNTETLNPTELSLGPWTNRSNQLGTVVLNTSYAKTLNPNPQTLNPKPQAPLSRARKNASGALLGGYRGEHRGGVQHSGHRSCLSSFFRDRGLGTSSVKGFVLQELWTHGGRHRLGRQHQIHPGTPQQIRRMLACVQCIDRSCRSSVLRLCPSSGTGSRQQQPVEP